FASGGAAQIGHHLNTVQGNVEYHYGTKLAGTFGLFDVTGTLDPLLYPQAAVTGSANGDPRSNGYILNLSWWPQQNIDLAAQYTGYWRFNGGQANYDGAGRQAGGNNAVFLLARFVF
ncbi:MAG: cytochrome C, partial [Candidatus Acidiferrales bacterium]